MATMRPRRPSPDVRRRHRRIPVLWTGNLGTGGESIDCAILNISGGGAKLRLTEPRAYGDRVDLTSPRFGSLHGRVVWREEAYVGVAFVDAPAEITACLGHALP